MFSTFLKEISGFFDRRFLLSAFFPTLAFGGLSLGMALMVWGPQAAIERWKAQSGELQALMAVGALGFVLFVAYMFNVFQTGLTRFYEGYWEGLWFLSWWGGLRRKFYERRWDYLNDEIERTAKQITELEEKSPPGETSEQKRERKREVERLRHEMERLEREWFLFLPPGKSYVMPTLLGNILRAAELYPMRRYQLDAVVAWPRLQDLLPEKFANSLRDAKANMDLLLVVTTLATVFALGWESDLGLFSERWDLFLLASIGWLLALFGYSGAVQAARSYGELIKAAFDLHRWELLKALHLKLPENYADEHRLWAEVSELLYRNYPPKPELFRYETEVPKAKTPAQPGRLKTLLSAVAQWLGLGDKPRDGK